MVSTLSSAALAANESAEVEALLKRGIQLRRDGADEDALAVFLEAEAKSPSSVRVLLHVATAAQAASKWVMADEYLEKASSHQEDDYYQRYTNEIEEVRAATALRVGRFRVLGEPDGAEVILNGESIGTLPMETPKTIEAGSYVLEVTKPGFYALRRPIAVRGGVLTRETVELNQRPAGAAASGAGDAAGAGGDVDLYDSAGNRQDWWKSSWVTWSLGGAAVASGVTSGIAFFLRHRATEHWNDNARCLDPAAPDAPRSSVCADVRDDIDQAEQVGIISGVIGIGFAGGALAHWLTTRDRGEAGMSSAQRDARKAGEIHCSPGLFNVACSGTF
jgi:hypothetical protein